MSCLPPSPQPVLDGVAVSLTWSRLRGAEGMEGRRGHWEGRRGGGRRERRRETKRRRGGAQGRIKVERIRLVALRHRVLDASREGSRGEGSGGEGGGGEGGGGGDASISTTEPEEYR